MRPLKSVTSRASIAEGALSHVACCIFPMESLQSEEQFEAGKAEAVKVFEGTVRPRLNIPDYRVRPGTPAVTHSLRLIALIFKGLLLQLQLSWHSFTRCGFALSVPAGYGAGAQRPAGCLCA
jgi:hypothetical protein